MSGFCSGCGKDVAVEDVRCFCEACASKRAESAPSAAPNIAMDAISLLGKWHRAYHDSRDALEKVDDDTVAFIAKQHQ